MRDRTVMQPMSSPVVLVEKKDGDYGFCTYYRRLNAVTKKHNYLLQRIDDMLEKLKGAQIFSTFDLASGYWQIPLYSPHKEKTAFVTHCGFYQYRVMPFGLTNAPATFQRAIEQIFWEYPVSIDDVIVCSKTHKRHRDVIQTFFEVVRSSNLNLGLKKCVFVRKRVAYLGHEVSATGIHVDPKKEEAAQKCPVPQCVKDIQAFFCFTGYYRRFLKD